MVGLITEVKHNNIEQGEKNMLHITLWLQKESYWL